MLILAAGVLMAVLVTAVSHASGFVDLLVTAAWVTYGTAMGLVLLAVMVGSIRRSSRY